LGQGNREQVTGNREQGTPKRVLGDFTFLHIPLNFPVHLLSENNLSLLQVGIMGVAESRYENKNLII
jgi:hypothetical protein